MILSFVDALMLLDFLPLFTDYAFFVDLSFQIFDIIIKMYFVFGILRNQFWKCVIFRYFEQKKKLCPCILRNSFWNCIKIRYFEKSVLEVDEGYISKDITISFHISESSKNIKYAV